MLWWAGSATGFIALVVGCGGGGGGGSASPTPTPTATATPTQASATPTPVPPPNTPFDLRGRVFISGVATAGVVVAVTGDSTSATASEQTVSVAGGYYSFLLGGGTYTVRATSGTRSAQRVITVPPFGQTVDNVNLNL
ncbi:MAG TPA: hypothetical protein VF719_08940 [Abditibacteriaceae bacterium]